MSADPASLIAQVRATTTAHRLTWQALVPDAFMLNPDAEAAEEAAYAAMARAKAALRDHIAATYGVSIGELTSLATP